jgi:TonB-dependent starch-binding outer membrane protein SusC
MQKTCIRKLLYAMKICAAQGLIAVFICGVSVAHDNYGQVLEKPVTISLSEIPFVEALKQLETVAQVKFFYSQDQIQRESAVTLNVVSQPLRRVLDALLVPRQFDYKVDDKDASISIKKQKAKQSYHHPAEIISTVSGLVTENSSGEPMAGVNIIIKGSAIGTTSDKEGRFSIEVSENDILIFSFIGYQTQEIKVDKQTTISVILIEDATSLQEVTVNAGYWQVDKKEGTGNIYKVTNEQIQRQPVTNPLQALQGRVPGVVITQNTGITGGSMNISIRGQNSLRADGNFPLYVIDGVPIDSRPIDSYSLILSKGFDPLNTINPDNIESIEILKDADATSIYGSRGANGVVLITTKSSKQGQTSLDVAYYGGGGKTTRQYNLLNTEEYLTMRQEAFSNDGATPGSADPDINGTWDSDKYTNWQESLFGGTASIHDVQSSLSGGNQTTSFRLGGAFRKETTVFPGDFGYHRATGNLSLNHNSENQRLSISFNLNYGSDKNSLFNRNPVFDALTLAPNAPIYHNNGELDWRGYSTVQKNPFSYLKVSHVTTTTNFIANTNISYQLIGGLKIKSSFGFTDTNTNELINTPKASMDPNNQVDSQSNFGDRRSLTWIAEPQLSFEKDWDDHHVNVLVGTTWQNVNTDFQWIQASGFLSDGLLGNINAATTVVSQRDDEILYRYNALFGRIGYNWKQKYFINLTARRDGSSRFGPDRQFANFGAAGIAWIFSKESFIADGLSALSFGKIRVSYGTSGSDQIGDYGFLSTYSASAFSYQNGRILLPTGLSNADYAWEVNRKIEAAIDLGVAEDRILISACYYRNQSSNQLVGYQLPAITGFTSVLANLSAKVENSGWEFELTTLNINKTNLTWRTAINLTVPKNELLEFPNIESSTYANTYVVGEPLSIRKVYHFEGLNQTTGLYQFTDVDGNGSFTTADRQTVINLSRRYYGGIDNTITFKGIELNFFFEYVNQNTLGYLSNFPNAPGTMSNQPSSVLDRWKGNGEETNVQKFTRTNSSSYQYLTESDFNQENSSFVRLKTLSLTYSFPTAIVSKAKLKGGAIFLRGQNLFTITDFEGLDPENAGNTQLPQLRVITAGLKLKI